MPSMGYLCSHLDRSGIILQFQSSSIYAYIVVLNLLVAFAQWLMVKALSTVSEYKLVYERMFLVSAFLVSFNLCSSLGLMSLSGPFYIIWQQKVKLYQSKPNEVCLQCLWWLWTYIPTVNENQSSKKIELRSCHSSKLPCFKFGPKSSLLLMCSSFCWYILIHPFCVSAGKEY